VPGVLDGLHPWRVRRELVLAEVGVCGTARDDERVVGQLERPPVRGGGQHHLVLEVQVVHVREQRAGVALLLDDAAQGRRDEPRRQDAGRDLVQQRLEQVVVGAVHHGDLDVVLLRQRPGDVEPPEPAAHDHDPVALVARHIGPTDRRGAR
jgi:hypothetical protein